MRISNSEVGLDHPPFIVAEISCSHMGNKAMAVRLIEVAAEAGADAVKLQLFSPADMAPDTGDYRFTLNAGPWKGRRLYDLYKEAATPLSWFPDLFAVAKEFGLTPFASVFSLDGVHYLEQLKCPAYKIASAEIGWTELLEVVRETGKPTLISTGMAEQYEIDEAAAVMTHDNWMFMHCVSAYPTEIEHAALWKMETYSSNDVGISDHSKGHMVPCMAVALGACVIEKHLMLEHTDTLDKAFALTPNEFDRMTRMVHKSWRAMQDFSGVEESSKGFKRRYYKEFDGWYRGA